MDEYFGELRDPPSFFKQNLRSMRLDVTPRIYIAIFSPVGLLFLVMGTAMIFSGDNSVEIAREYGRECGDNSKCIINISIPPQMTNPVALLFELRGLHLNHWLISKSRNDEQLMGGYVRFDEMEKCLPYRSINDDPSPNQWILPCGLQSMMFFNDTFEFVGPQGHNFTFLEPNPPSSGIAFNQLSSMYITGNRWLDKYSQWPVGQVQQRFSSWMDTPAFSSFRRVLGVTSDNGFFPEGIITIEIENNWNATLLGVEKRLVFTTTSPAPASSIALGSLFLVGGCIMEAAVFIALIFKPRVSDAPR